MNDPKNTVHPVDAHTLTIFGSEWGTLTEFPASLSTLERLEKLKISRATIDDITLIEGMSNLRELTLELSTLRDLSPLANLKKLKFLNLDYSIVTNTQSISSLNQLETLQWVDASLEDTDTLMNLKKLIYLDLRRSKIESLNGLSELKKLENLYISHTKVKDLSPLIALDALRKININHTEISDLSPLENNSELQSLFFSGTKVVDLKPLSNLKSLSAIQLYGTEVRSLSGLEGLNNVISLNLNDTQVDHISPLSSLTKLEGLGLRNTNVRNLKGIEGAKRLRRLHLSGSQVSDISAVKRLRSLEYIDLSKTQIVDISPLADLRRLEKVNLSGSKVDDVEALSQLNMLRSLNLNDTPVLDLRPVTELKRLKTFSKDGGLQFEGTQAAKTDPEIARISANPKERARATALYSQLENWDLPTDIDIKSREAFAPPSSDFAFISYAHQDSDLIGDIHHFLTEQSLPLWWDSDLGAGDSWRNEISQKLSEAKVVVTFWTKNSVKSPSVIEEASNAQKLGKLVHVRLDASPLPYGFAETQYLELRDWDGTPNHYQMRKLIQSIRDKLEPLSVDELSQKILASSPVALVPEEGKLTPKDTPPNARPEVEYAVDLEERLIGLRQTVGAAISKANDSASYQLPNDLRHSLSAIENALEQDKISWYGMEDTKESLIECMQYHRASEAWNEVIVADLNRIKTRIEELRPLLQPKQIPVDMYGAKPPELDPVIVEDQLPDISEMARNLQHTLFSDDGSAVLDDAALSLAEKEIDIFQSIERELNVERKLSIARRSLRKVAYVVGGAIAAISTPVMVNLLTAPEAAVTLAARLRPIYEFILRFF